MSIKSRIALLTDGKQIPAAPDGSVLSTLSWEGYTIEKHLLSPGELPEHTILGHRLTITTDKIPVNFEFREKANGNRSEHQFTFFNNFLTKRQ